MCPLRRRFGMGVTSSLSPSHPAGHISTTLKAMVSLLAQGFALVGLYHLVHRCSWLNAPLNVCRGSNASSSLASALFLLWLPRAAWVLPASKKLALLTAKSSGRMDGARLEAIERFFRVSDTSSSTCPIESGVYPPSLDPCSHGHWSYLGYPGLQAMPLQRLRFATQTAPETTNS
jgi:hypothetical protein